MSIGRIGLDFIVNATTTSVQRETSVTALADGRFVVAWNSSDTGDGSGSCVRGRIFNANGSAVPGGDFLVNTTGTSDQEVPSLTALADGRFVVMWRSEDTGDGSLGCVRGRIFNSDGTGAGSDFIVDTATANDQGLPSVAALADGRIIVTWESFDSGVDTDIRGRILNADGTPDLTVNGGNDFVVNSATPDQETNPSVTVLADGRFVVIWETGFDLDDGSGAGIRGRIYNADGSTVGSDFLVNTTTTGNQQQPSVTARSDGRFVVTWHSDDSGDSEVRGRLFNADGSAPGNDFLVNSTTASFQSFPSVAALTDGRWIVAWQSFDAGDGSGSCIRARLYNADGSAASDDFIVNTTATSAQRFPAVTALADGHFVIAWESDDTGDGSGGCVRAQLFDLTVFNGTAAADTWQGTSFNDTITGGADNDTLGGVGGNDTISGDAGNDTLTGGVGNDNMFGGTGTDTAVFSGARAAYTITPLGSTFQISGPDGLDVLTNVEFAQFDDMTVPLTSGGPSNQPPTITSNGGGASASVTIGENTTAVTTVMATDPDAGTTLTYSISGGADLAKFQINSTTGALSFLAAPNFEAPTDSDHNNSYIVQVRASDGSLFDDQVITVNVSDLSESAVGNDFNADRRADILWQTDNGALAIWEMNGIQIGLADYTRLGQSAVGQPGADWHIVDTADVDGDSKSDILWRTDSGALALWEMDGTQVKSADFLRLGTAPIGAPGPDWHALGANDFDGDGKSDILWRTDSGALAIWEMDGNQIKLADYIRLGSTAVGGPAPDWKIVGVGDFDADGKGDLLWETGGGALAVWQMDGTHIKSADYVKSGPANVGIPGADWHVANVGDFDGDGKADILWRIGAATPPNGFPPGGGQVAIWEMNGNQIEFADYTKLGSTNVGAPGTDWHLLGSDDYNGDGMNDIVWRTDAGALAIWEMSGAHILAADYTKIGAANVGAPGADWHVFQHHYDLI